MRNIIFSLLITFSATLFVSAQSTDPILLTIDGKAITQSEFERIYTKNNQEPAFDKASLDEYMKLFVNFKLKVIEAEALGMDTLKSFITELKGYRSQLEKPYFTDESADEALIQEAYERMKWNVRASHILLKCDANALPSDTLKAYNKIAKIKKRALKGEDFNKLAKEFSEDPSAERNGGDLGFFTAFSMVYPFESGAYNTPVGEISTIIRTKFGYHILKVTEKREDRGQVKVAHLMRAVPQGSSIEKENLENQKIQSLYDSIQAGANFEKMVAQYSDDRGTSKKGGELPFFGAGRMIPEFEKAAFGLKEIGAIAKPVKTAYGYHIIKLLDVKPLETYEELKPTIKNKVSKDIRAKRGKQMVMERLKKEYNFTLNKKSMELFYITFDSTLYNGAWDAKKVEGAYDVILTIADTIKYTQQDFASKISNDGLRRVNKPLQILADEEINRWAERMLTNFEKSRLEEKYPDFKHLTKEYHDGILLFNLTDKMVWSKAVEDTVGLEKFYDENKTNYMWGNRVEASLYTFNNKEWEAKITKLAKKVGKKNLNTIEARNSFMAKAIVKDSTLTLKVEKNKFSKGDNDVVDAIEWVKGIKATQDRDGSFVLVYVNGAIDPEPKKLNEARGLITADYQNFLEKVWLEELRNKYSIEINEDVFNKMVK